MNTGGTKARDPLTPAPIAVIGMGNVLLGDDGFGPCVVGILSAGWEFCDNVELIDAGTPGLDLAGLLCGRQAVVFVDSVAATAAPGTLRFYRDGELQGALALKPRVSPHDPALAEALAIARLVGDGPQSVLLVGVVPESVEVGVGLSPSVTSAAHRAAEAVLTELQQWGAAHRRRDKRKAPTLWWVDERRSEAARGQDGNRT
ncbi:MAG: hydrogenase maturation protease [Candidatus Binatia bacterium]